MASFPNKLQNFPAELKDFFPKLKDFFSKLKNPPNPFVGDVQKPVKNKACDKASLFYTYSKHGIAPGALRNPKMSLFLH